ncbi:MAG: response regulator [Acidobacteria bacterium]|nr:response regulator [Acidobacteriota bacterium]
MDSAAARILIVDDEPPLLKLMHKYLARCGYAVESTISADDAWSRIQAEPSSYALILVDMTMPGMNGAQLARKILDCDSCLRVIACSGYPIDMVKFKGDDPGRVGFLHKPFTPDMLSREIKRLLG